MAVGLGVLLCTLVGSNECLAGLCNLYVASTRGIATIKPDQRWSADALTNIKKCPQAATCHSK